MAGELAENGWTTVDGFFPESLVRNLRTLAEQDFAAGHFKKAGIGRGDNFRIDPQLRADYVRWLDDYEKEPAVAAATSLIQDFRIEVNQALFLGLRDIEAHLTKYPAGAGYAKHLDRFADKGTRTLSMVVYLNENWTTQDGGALRIFSRDDREQVVAEILPEGGRLVTFLSDEIWHEVSPNLRERYSLTGWFLR